MFEKRDCMTARTAGVQRPLFKFYQMTLVPRQDHDYILCSSMIIKAVLQSLYPSGRSEHFKNVLWLFIFTFFIPL